MLNKQKSIADTNQGSEIMLYFLFLLYLIWDAGPYFTWSTYYNGIFNNIGGVDFISLIFLLILPTYIIHYCKDGVIKCSKFQWVSTVTFLGVGSFLLLICGFKWGNFLSGKWVPHFTVALFLLVSKETKKRLYKWYITYFAITLILPIIYYTLHLIGIEVPHGTLESFENIKQYYSYDWYPGAVVLRHFYDGILYRLCGIYNEAGQLGTMAALFLTIEGYELKGKWRNIIIFIGGVLSFSLAFYVLTIVYTVLHNIWKGRLKNAIVIISVIIGYIVFISIPIENPNIKSVQSRIVLTTNGLRGDNRTNDAYDQIFRDYLSSSNLSTLMLGNGDGTMASVMIDKVVDGSSYKKIIYDYGIIGAIMIVCWILYYSISKSIYNKNRYIALAALIYIINFYQRPVVFKPAYLVILLAGIETMNSNMQFKTTQIGGEIIIERGNAAKTNNKKRNN